MNFAGASGGIGGSYCGLPSTCSSQLSVASPALFGWRAGETFAAYAAARRRWQLGLCTRMVCNRYLLLGLAASLWVTTAVLSASDYIVFALTGSWSRPIDYVLGVVEFASIATVWLAFIPPTFYQHWIDGTAPVAKAVEG